MNFTYFNLQQQPVTIDLPISHQRFEELKANNKGREVQDLDDWEFWNLRDHLFATLVINSFKNVLTLFFEKLQLNLLELQKMQGNREVKGIEIYFHYYLDNQIYIFSEPSTKIHAGRKEERFATTLDFEVAELESLLEQLLSAFGVDYTSFKEFDNKLSFDDLEVEIMFLALAFECWANAKSSLPSNAIGIITYASDGGFYVDLENGNRIDPTYEAIALYLQGR